jgi:hypothetical protein
MPHAVRAHFVAAALLLGSACARVSRGQDLDGPKHIFQGALLDNLVGSWRLASTVPGRSANHTEEEEWVSEPSVFAHPRKGPERPVDGKTLMKPGFWWASTMLASVMLFIAMTSLAEDSPRPWGTGRARATKFVLSLSIRWPLSYHVSLVAGETPVDVADAIQEQVRRMAEFAEFSLTSVRGK